MQRPWRLLSFPGIYLKFVHTLRLNRALFMVEPLRALRRLSIGASSRYSWLH